MWQRFSCVFKDQQTLIFQSEIICNRIQSTIHVRRCQEEKLARLFRVRDTCLLDVV